MPKKSLWSAITSFFNSGEVAEAANKQDWVSLRKLVEQGYDPNAFGSYDDNALHVVVLYKRHREILFLLQNDASSNALSKNEVIKINRCETPLQMAVRFNDLLSSKLLVIYGADVKALSSPQGMSLESIYPSFVKIVKEFSQVVDKIERLLSAVEENFKRKNEALAIQNYRNIYSALEGLLRDEKEPLVQEAYVNKIVRHCEELIEQYNIHDSELTDLVEQFKLLSYPQAKPIMEAVPLKIKQAPKEQKEFDGFFEYKKPADGIRKRRYSEEHECLLSYSGCSDTKQGNEKEIPGTCGCLS